MKKWAFIVHPRDRYDVKIACKNFLGEIAFKLFKGPHVLSKVDNFADGGFLIVLSLLPEDMYRRPKKAREKILEGVKFAQNLGSSIIGLGELTAPFTQAGRYLLDKIPPEVLVTTGNTLTAGIVAHETKGILEDFPDGTLVGIVGATGSIGSAVTQILAEEGTNLLLVARNEARLTQLTHRIHSKTKVKCVTDLQTLITTDIVIVLTSGRGSIIKTEHLKKNAVVYDITQPSNITPDLLKARSDITLIKGGLVTNPGIKLKIDLRLPGKTVFACLAETLILAKEDLNFPSDQLTGNVNPELAKLFVRKATRYGFLSPLSPVSIEKKRAGSII